MLPRYDEPEGASCWLKPCGWFGGESCPTYELSSIKVPPLAQKRGVGSRLLRRVCAVADQREVALILQVSADFNGWMTNAQLYLWYQRHGFEMYGAYGSVTRM